jgi:hypothetical protein
MMRSKKQKTSDEAKLAIAAFGFSGICLAAALIGPHGLLTSAPTLDGAGSIVAAAAFFLLGVHLRGAATSSKDSPADYDET